MRDEIEAAALSVRPGPPKARDGAVDEAGIVLRQSLIAQAQPVERAGPKVLGDRVGRGDQLAQHLAPAIRLQVDGDPALVAVHHHEGRGLAADRGRRQLAGVVTVRRALDLDHVGAHVGEHKAANRPSHDVAELDNAHPGKGTSALVGFAVSAVARPP